MSSNHSLRPILGPRSALQGSPFCFASLWIGLRAELSVEPAAPLFQRLVTPTNRQPSCTSSLDFQDLEGLFVNAHSKTGAAVTIFTISANPLAGFECRPSPFLRDLISTLDADGPFTIAIIEPHIGRSRVLEPPAPHFKVGWRSFGN